MHHLGDIGFYAENNKGEVQYRLGSLTTQRTSTDGAMFWKQ
jgi:hypothetical protein